MAPSPLAKPPNPPSHPTSSLAVASLVCGAQMDINAWMIQGIRVTLSRGVLIVLGSVFVGISCKF